MTDTGRPDRAPRDPDARTPPKSARRRSRELAMQGLYQWLLSREDAGAIEAHLAATSPNFDKADRGPSEELRHGSSRGTAALHAQIEPFLDRRVAELSPVEHATLLVGAFELTRHLEIPYRVVINEAVELAKTFGGTDGYKYINGVLDKVAARARPAEIRPR
ncbi:MAG TPA: transcription antitermination factor NusB [Burkholderiaceae bacterium]|nr:transcription antitermination factor NusB [Burkholderiaceae bacterium]